MEATALSAPARPAQGLPGASPSAAWSCPCPGMGCRHQKSPPISPHPAFFFGFNDQSNLLFSWDLWCHHCLAKDVASLPDRPVARGAALFLDFETPTQGTACTHGCLRKVVGITSFSICSCLISLAPKFCLTHHLSPPLLPYL